MYTNAENGLPKVEFVNLISESEPIAPRKYYTMDSLSPAIGQVLTSPLTMMGTPPGGGDAECGVRWNYFGCAFNMIYASETRVFTFKNKNWDMAW